jgi:hypothetical protein
MCIWMYYILCVQCAGFVISAVLVILYSVKIYISALSTTAEKTVVDKVTNLL